MKPDQRWQQVKDIFNSALNYQSDERRKFVLTACQNDDSLRREVESLLLAHEKPGSFIDSPAFAVAAEIPSTVPELKTGDKIGCYEVLSFVGSGGMGEVYEARDTRLGRKIALKFLTRFFMQDKERLARFEQEARATSSLNHPNILTVYEIGGDETRRFIATEFIQGITLRDRIQGGSIKLNEALSIVEQILSALVAAHAAGVVHRDIKPENIMLRNDGIVKVLDFGLAKLALEPTIDRSTRKLIQTSAGIVMGTVTYMSPEQARGLAVDARTDIWSLGVVFYELLVGRRPFEGPTTSDVIASVLEREPKSITSELPDIPESLEWIITKALTKDREERYQTAREMLSDLKRLKERLHVSAALEQTVSPRVPELNRQTPVKDRSWSTYWPALGLFIVLVLAVVSFVIYRPTSVEQPEQSASVIEILRTTQIPTRTGFEIPALSPDGNSIVYSSNGEIYVKPLTHGSREIQLTSDAQTNVDPAWSPDGRWIAFASRNRGGIWLIPATGGLVKQLTTFGAAPAWSRDGSTIAFQSEGYTLPPTTIWKVSSEGGDATQVTQVGNPSGGHSLPAWSPDGKRIAFATDDGTGSGQFWTVRADGADLKPGARHVVSPLYSPDGQYVYGVSGVPGGNLGLLRVRISPTGEPLGQPEVVRDTGVAYIQGRLTISADGKKLAYNSRTLSGNLMSLRLLPSGEPEGEPTAVTQGTSFRKAAASFSRDGKKIAFTEFRGGESQSIWVVDSDGQNAAQVTAGNFNWMPNWLPDNDTIAFQSDRDDKQRLFTISLSTGQEKLLFDPQQTMGWPRISPDGKQVAFNSTKSGTINVWAASLEGGGIPRQLTVDNETMGWPCWSPDGRFIAVQIKRGEDTNIALMPSAGGEVTQLTFDRGLTFLNDWSPDGDKLLFAGRRQGVWNIYWYSLSSKKQKQLTHYTEQNRYVRYPVWSPLGNEIVYELTDLSANVWLMEFK